MNSVKKSQVCAIIALCAAALAILFWFLLPCISYDYGNNSIYGYGGNDDNETINGLKMIFNSSALRFGFIFAVAGLIISVIIIAGGEYACSKSKVLPAISLVCFVFAALFCFLAKSTVTDEVSKYIKLGTGSIMAGLLFLGSAVASLISLVSND